MKKADKTLALTTLLCLLPMAAGLFLWDQLPQEMPIHWNAAGQVDNYGSRALAVVGLPCSSVWNRKNSHSGPTLKL